MAARVRLRGPCCRMSSPGTLLAPGSCVVTSKTARACLRVYAPAPPDAPRLCAGLMLRGPVLRTDKVCLGGSRLVGGGKTIRPSHPTSQMGMAPTGELTLPVGFGCPRGPLGVADQEDWTWGFEEHPFSWPGTCPPSPLRKGWDYPDKGGTWDQGPRGADKWAGENGSPHLCRGTVCPRPRRRVSPTAGTHTDVPRRAGTCTGGLGGQCRDGRSPPGGLPEATLSWWLCSPGPAPPQGHCGAPIKAQSTALSTVKCAHFLGGTDSSFSACVQGLAVWAESGGMSRAELSVAPRS